MHDDFGSLLRSYRRNRGIRALAPAVPCDVSYWERLESGGASHPGRELVDAMARALSLSGIERSRLLVAAGLAPQVLIDLGWDDVLQDVVGVLTDRRLQVEDVEDFREMLSIMAHHFKGSGVQVVELSERRAS